MTLTGFGAELFLAVLAVFLAGDVFLAVLLEEELFFAGDVFAVVLAFFAVLAFLVAELVVLVFLAVEDFLAGDFFAALLEDVFVVAVVVLDFFAGEVVLAVSLAGLLVRAAAAFASVVVVEDEVAEVDAEDGAELPAWLADDVVLAGAGDDDVVLVGVVGVSLMDDSPGDVKGG